jgi:hypothetical protein
MAAPRKILAHPNRCPDLVWRNEGQGARCKRAAIQLWTARPAGVGGYGFIVGRLSMAVTRGAPWRVFIHRGGDPPPPLTAAWS